MSRRFVRVVIYDPDEQLSPEDALVYLSKPFLTDEGDEEIFLGLDFVSLLEAHNAKRVHKDYETIALKPAKIGDLVRRIIVL